MANATKFNETIPSSLPWDERDGQLHEFAECNISVACEILSNFIDLNIVSMEFINATKFWGKPFNFKIAIDGKSCYLVFYIKFKEMIMTLQRQSKNFLAMVSVLPILVPIWGKGLPKFQLIWFVKYKQKIQGQRLISKAHRNWSKACFIAVQVINFVYCFWMIIWLQQIFSMTLQHIGQACIFGNDQWWLTKTVIECFYDSTTEGVNKLKYVYLAIHWNKMIQQMIKAGKWKKSTGLLLHIITITLLELGCMIKFQITRTSYFNHWRTLQSFTLDKWVSLCHWTHQNTSKWQDVIHSNTHEFSLTKRYSYLKKWRIKRKQNKHRVRLRKRKSKN